MYIQVDISAGKFHVPAGNPCEWRSTLTSPVYIRTTQHTYTVVQSNVIPVINGHANVVYMFCIHVLSISGILHRVSADTEDQLPILHIAQTEIRKRYACERTK